MVVFSIFLIVILVASITLNVLLIKTINKQQKIIDEIEIQLEKTLDVLDQVYSVFGRILQTPTLSDDPVTKEFVKNLQYVHSSILLLANILANNEQEDHDLEKEKNA